MANPYWKLSRRLAANRRVVHGWWRESLHSVWPLAIGAALYPWWRPVFLGFLEGSPKLWPAGTESLLQRAAVLIIGGLALEVYSALIRSPDRAVQELHPVHPAEVVLFELQRIAWRRVPWAIAISAGLWPLIAVNPSLGGGAVVAVWGYFAAGLTVSAAVHLFAVELADSPEWAPFLDRIRGVNPRAQAAFLYAPGAALGIAGLAAFGAASAVKDGSWILLAGPYLLAGAAALTLRQRANRAWFRASAILADIDARYAMLTLPEEGRKVYLEGIVKRLPISWRPFALNDLRRGWRARRSWISGAWIAGFSGAWLTWGPEVSDTVAAFGWLVAGIWGVGAVGFVLEKEEPYFLSQLIPWSTVRWASRSLVVFLWLIPMVVPASLAAQRHGLGWRFAAGLMAISFLASLFSAALSRIPTALWWYLPVAGGVSTLFVIFSRSPQ